MRRAGACGASGADSERKFCAASHRFPSPIAAHEEAAGQSPRSGGEDDVVEVAGHDSRISFWSSRRGASAALDRDEEPDGLGITPISARKGVGWRHSRLNRRAVARFWCPKPALTTLVPRAGALACLASLNLFVGLINDQSGKVNRLLCGSTFPSKLATAPNPSNTLAK